MTRDQLSAILTRAWSELTSNDSTWSPMNPALGQCAITACVVQDVFGGEIRRVRVAGSSHYFNVFGNLKIEVVDLTASQFDETPSYRDAEVTSREYILSFESTRIRYWRLCASLLEQLVEPALVGFNL